MVVTGFEEPKMGNTIPQAVVTSPDMSEIWGQMSYEDLKQDKKYREMKKQIKAICDGAAEPEEVPDRVLYWPVKEGDGYFIGSFQKLDEKEKLILKKKDGQVIKIGLDRLSDRSVALAKTLAGQKAGGGGDDGGKNAPDFESWTGSNGKVIQARFLKFSDGKVTLEMESGKTYTLPLERLAASSQQRAKELGGE